MPAKRSGPIGGKDFKPQLAALSADPKVRAWLGKLLAGDKPAERKPKGKRLRKK